MEETKKMEIGFWKNLFTKVTETLTDHTGQGSSKRASTFWLIVFVFTPLQSVYTWAFAKVVRAASKTSYVQSVMTPGKTTTYAFNADIDGRIMDLFIPDVALLIVLILLFAGLTSMEKLGAFSDSIGNLINKIKGVGTQS